MADERFSAAVKTKGAMIALLASEGWKELDGVLAEREEIVMSRTLDPMADISDSELREARMAIINLRAVRHTPQVMLEDADEVIKAFAEPEPEEVSSDEDDGDSFTDEE